MMASSNGNSSLLVSEEELRVYLGLNGKVTSQKVGREEDISVSLLAKDSEIAILKGKNESLERENTQLLANISQMQQSDLDRPIIDRINALSRKHPRYGYCRIAALLRR